jgi:hypothetical protein
METFLVISPHTAEDCRKTIDYFHEYHEGYLKKFWWGCMDNDHHAYTIIEADSHEHAIQALPPLARKTGTTIRLVHFDKEIPHKA